MTLPNPALSILTKSPHDCSNSSTVKTRCLKLYPGRRATKEHLLKT
jgi:hypothetical protein